MIMCFTSLSALFQSYGDDDSMIMKAVCNITSFTGGSNSDSIWIAAWDR